MVIKESKTEKGRRNMQIRGKKEKKKGRKLNIARRKSKEWYE